MRRARFQLFRVGNAAVAWRFVSANNWELARSPGWYDDERVARRAVAALMAQGAAPFPSVGLDASGRWRWTAAVDGHLAAVSSRAYFRRVECDSALNQFRGLLPTAELRADVAVLRLPANTLSARPVGQVG